MPTTGSDDIRDIDPETVEAGEVDIDRVEAGLRSDENLVRTHAAQLTTAVAADDPRAIRPLVPTLADLFDDDRSVVLKEVLFALSLLAEADPDAVVDVADGLVGVLDHDLPVIHSAGARALRPLAVECPEAFVDHVDDLMAVVERPVSDPMEGLDPSPNPDMIRTETVENVRGQSRRRQVTARVVAATVIVEVADIEPAAVRPHVDRLVDLLDDDNPAVRAASAGVLATAAEHRPDDIGEAVPSLVDALEDVDDTTRARAVAALGYIGDDVATGPLRDLAADEDADENLREMAAETADFLAGQ
jgi:HEAT repeat protein